MNDRRTGIYAIVNTANGKRYIGSAVNFSRRHRKHWRELRGGNHHSRILQASWDYYGEAAFEFRPLLVCSRDDLLMYEQRLLDGLRPALNVCRIVGSRLGVVMTDEHKKKIRDAHLRSGHRPSQDAASRGGLALTGRARGPMSQEAKHRLSISRTGKGCGTRNAGVGEKISAALKGRTLSHAHRAAMSRAMTGKKQSPEHIARAAAARTGKKRRPYKKHSAEANAAKSIRQRRAREGGL